MTSQKTWIELLGTPQGNEIVWANEIIRKTSQFSYETLWKFDNHTHAKNCFEIWLKDQKEMVGITMTDCEHKDYEDCLICCSCGRCSESLDDEDYCADCAAD